MGDRGASGAAAGPAAGRPAWGTRRRDVKARKILRVMERFGPAPLAGTTWVDLGCGSGGIAVEIAPHVGEIVGVDPEPWPEWEQLAARAPNLRFLPRPMERLPLPDESVDVVVCNQVYEHVPDPRLLLRQIRRILRPGGVCYFAGPNLLFPVEPHVFWPFVHWLPRGFAVRLMRGVGARKVVEANSVSYWTLTGWLGEFEVRNVLPDILADPVGFGLTGHAARLLALVPRRLTAALTWISPAFVFVLRKPPSPAPGPAAGPGP